MIYLLVQRNILIDNILGLPIQEALVEIGIASQFNIIGTDTWPNIPPNLNTTFQILDNLSFYSSLGNTVEVYSIDWFVTVYPFSIPQHGKRDENLHTWLLEVSKKIETLIKTCSLQVAIIFLPITFPAPHTELKKVIQLPTHWTTKCYTIRNCSHGGSIETDHSVVVAVELTMCNYITLPPVTSPPSSMLSILVRHTLPTLNTATGDLVLMNPTPAYRAGSDSVLQATTAKLIKNKVDVTPIQGWSVFDVNGPGPNISLVRPEQTFFQGLFAVWYQKTPSCCPVDTKNVLLLLGLHESHITLLCSLPPNVCEKRCRTYPGKEYHDYPPRQ